MKDNITPEGSPYDILLLEKDFSTIRLLTRYFESKGVTSKAVVSGVKGLEELEHNTPRLIVMCIMLPDYSGFELCKKIKSNPKLKHIPVFFCTAFPGSEVEKHLVETKANGYILKPFKLSEFDGILDLLNLPKSFVWRKINQYITLKLENGKTQIYVKNKFGKDSVYETADLYQKEIVEGPSARPLHENHDINPEQEFWGICSNLQEWYENGYDTRLLHTNLAFNLLKALVKAGDLIAKRVFKTELAFIFNNLDVGKFIALDLSNLYLNTIPSSIQNFKNLKKLDLSGNHLSALPDSISHLQLLRELNLKHNEFASFPASVLNLKALEKLDISNNLITRIPEEITELELKTINMSSCNLTEIPEIIMELKTLEELNLSENKTIKRLPESIGNLKSLRVLELRWLSLEELPESIGNLTDLLKLDLTYNWLQYLPESIGNLINLEELILYANNLKELPKSVENLKNLKKLILTKNLLEELPKFLSNLKNLRDLTYEYNEFNKHSKAEEELIQKFKERLQQAKEERWDKKKNKAKKKENLKSKKTFKRN